MITQKHVKESSVLTNFPTSGLLIGEIFFELFNLLLPPHTRFTLIDGWREKKLPISCSRDSTRRWVILVSSIDYTATLSVLLPVVIDGYCSTRQILFIFFLYACLLFFLCFQILSRVILFLIVIKDWSEICAPLYWI